MSFVNPSNTTERLQCSSLCLYLCSAPNMDLNWMLHGLNLICTDGDAFTTKNTRLSCYLIVHQNI